MTEEALLRLKEILSQSQQISAYVRDLYIEDANIASILDVCAAMVNVTSLALHNIIIDESAEVSFGCRLIESFPFLSALTITNCSLNVDSDPRLLEALGAEDLDVVVNGA